MAYTNLLLSQRLNSLTNDEEERRHKKIYDDITQKVSTLPRMNSCVVREFYVHKDGWCMSLPVMVGSMVAQQHFKARPSDLILASYPKSGTTWLKALLFATVHRKSNTNPNTPHPLEALSPHQCVPFLESQVYTNNQIPNLDSLPSPRLFATHIPFCSLPESILASNSKIIYICREPKDNLISLWHFTRQLRVKANLEPCPLEEAIEFFCNGVSLFGSLWDHVLGYWNKHLERPDQVLFLTYEGLSQDPRGHLKRLAEFIGHPFSADEEKGGGVLDAILKLCGIENLRSLEVNRCGKMEMAEWPVENGIFFRRGGMNDWVNHLTPEMARRIDDITDSKFRAYGLTFL